MGYATISHVQARCPQRRITASSTPNTTDVVGFLDDTAAELDGLLRGAGYTLPVPATATQAKAWLRRANAAGAALLVEQAAPTGKPDAGKLLAAEWERMQAQIAGTGKGPVVELDLARSSTSTYARGKSLEELGLSSMRFSASGLEL